MTQIGVDEYRVLFDRQADGYRASFASADCHEGVLLLTFKQVSDGARGLPQQWIARTSKSASWSNPEPFGPPLSKPDESSQYLSFAGRTGRGTLLVAGWYIDRGIREGVEADLWWRPGEVLIGRQERGATSITWTRHATGTFLGEQFAAPGLVPRSGRAVLSIWGAAERGDNWQCGVLLSDDDGQTWRYRRVGYEPDRAIRLKPDMPAGYNEQTLFECHDGMLVSIIRGRERLGAADASGVETFFFRSESTDGGETWSTPKLTNLAGTGASFNGVTLPDHSLLMAARIPHPHARGWVQCKHPELHGLHLARSFDGGNTWRTEAILQHDPAGKPFDYYYNAMNGQFVRLAADRWLYVFGHFDHLRDRHRTLGLTVTALSSGARESGQRSNLPVDVETRVNHTLAT